MQRKFLWRPDPPNRKYRPAAPILKAVRAAGLPTHALLNNLIPDILDQGGLGSCAANAIAQGLRASMLHESTPGWPQLASRLWLYYFMRKILGTADSDSGACIQDGFDVIRKLGYCAESIWPYDDGPTRFKTFPSAAAARAAFDQLGGVGYYRIDSEGDQRLLDVRAAVASGHTVVFGTQVARAMMDFGAGTAPLNPPGPNEPILGGHGLLIAGYEPGFFWIVNSWGKDYGIDGWLKMTDAYIADPRSADFWIIDNTPRFSEQA